MIWVRFADVREVSNLHWWSKGFFLSFSQKRRVTYLCVRTEVRLPEVVRPVLISAYVTFPVKTTHKERESKQKNSRERENVSLHCLFFFFLWRRKGLEDLRHGSWICRGRKVGVTNHATRIDSLPQCRSLKLVRCGWATVSFLSSSALSRVASFTRRRRARRCCLVVLRR